MVVLSVIILNYNTKDLTKQCLTSLENHYREELRKGVFEIIVVDNASTDTSASVISNLKSQISNLTLIKNKENVGFSKGNNIGAKNAKGRYLLFLNSDTEVGDNGLLSAVSYVEEHKDIGVLGAKLRNADGFDQASTGKFYTIGNVFLMLFLGERFGLLRTSPKTISEVDWVSGAALLIRKKLFDQLGGFDDHFFMYMEDMELCYRVKKISYQVVFYPYTVIYHKELGSSNRGFAIAHIYKGLLYFYKKHMNYIQYVIVKMLLITKAYVAIAIGIFTNNTYLRSTYRQALAFSL
ncbi:MAG: glycosyltransferase family 2 protein [Candidatus Levybacteria bacterium]|nr:glycosyltransferase family 2 protein [Candidatus Levybacteria bacterium]